MAPRPAGLLLQEARKRLAAAGCETASLDARLLLQAAAGLTYEAIVMAPERMIAAKPRAVFEDFISRRLAHEPVSRILGCRDFYGRVFKVTPDVLDPRPDTETLIAAALAVLEPEARLLDLGTGSGAIIVTLLAERPGTTGLATDLSGAAVAVARHNADALGVGSRLVLAQGSWFAPVKGRFDLIVSNPPYIPGGEIAGLDPDVKDYDPLGALDGGPDGLQPYREIAAGAAQHLAPEGWVMVEIGAGQADDVTGIFAANGYNPAGRHSDLGGHLRCLAFRLC